MNDGCSRICLTPTRNEAWIIKHFLAAARHWADHVIVADQGSTDGTLEILQDTPGSEVVLNQSPTYDESHRQQLLIDRARKIAGKRIFIALDADEALSANCLASKEWGRIAEAEPGTVLRFRWVNVLPGFQKAWISPGHVPLGFVDDGSEHQPTRIHSRRIPWPDGAPVIDLDEIVVLHFQYVVWERMVSKQRWYQAWEHAVHRKQTPLEIYRGYNHMARGWNADEILPMRREWMDEYDREGISFRSLQAEPVRWWDQEVLEMIREHGPQYFRKIDIWSHDWTALASEMGLKSQSFGDPRSFGDRAVHRLLAVSQNHRTNWGVRAFERLLRLSGW